MTMSKKSPRPISPLYAPYLTSDEKNSLRAVPVTDTTSEVNLLRVLFAHFIKFQQSLPKGMEAHVQNMRTALVLGEQFAKLIRAHNYENDPLAAVQNDMLQALAEIRQELGID